MALKMLPAESLGSESARRALENEARSVNPEAYDLYLRGRTHSRRENRKDNAAIELLEKAVAADPSLAAAHSAEGNGS